MQQDANDWYPVLSWLECKNNNDNKTQKKTEKLFQVGNNRAGGRKADSV